jgi:hypothetical protein
MFTWEDDERTCDNDIQLVVEIFQQIYQPQGEVIDNPTEYVKRCKKLIKSAGPELNFLGLAHPDKKSPFGWRPTSRLRTYIAQRLLGKKSKGLLYEAEPMYEILRDYIFGPAKPFDADDVMGPREMFGNHFLARDLLVALNLLRPGKQGDWVTSELHDLFCSGCRFKRKERIRRRRLRNAQKGLPVTVDRVGVVS